MTVTDKYWLQVNKKYFKYDIIGIIIFSGFLGFASPLGICFYMYRIISYSMRYLNINSLFSGGIEGLNQVLTMPFSREQIYKTYIKMILSMSAIFTAIVSLSKYVYVLIGGQGTAVYEDGMVIHTNLITNTAYYLLFLCSLILLIITLVNRINSNTPKTKGNSNIFTFLMIIYLVLINFVVMTLFLRSSLGKNIYFSVSFLAAILLIFILVKSLKKNYKEFVLRYRRYIHVD
ncbi:hypothetical protein JK636_16545 [Clostridium sp. YIM B02515]|uniref:Uncharacterized protein n=1 Tax=Clostridium rhizosphaerae TaxID=2803861 RepID=A0ABS1TGA2_9CLOT|nr:hypothetical protein [Clostridium rhizosphaerae]MBL4937339.1 hypothetical protein [Clostridium rhizosphaerae]